MKIKTIIEWELTEEQLKVLNKVTANSTQVQLMDEFDLTKREAVVFQSLYSLTSKLSELS